MTSKINWSLDAERDLWAAICAPNHWYDPTTGEPGGTHAESLWWFIHIAWGAEFYMRSKKRRWLTRVSETGYDVHHAYLQWLQKNLLEWKHLRSIGKGKRLYLAIILPRNFGKSITATRCASLWTHLDDPDMSTLIGSSTTKLSEDFINSIGITIAGQNKEAWFAWLYGNWKNPQREWTKHSIHHGFRQNTALQEPSFDMTSMEIGMTGYHHDQHWWDDPISQNRIRDEGTYIDNVHKAFNATYKALQTDGLLALVCTRYLDDDVAGRHLLYEGIKTWDGMECPNTMIFGKHEMGKGAWRVYFWQAEDEIAAKPTCPEIMDEERIKEEKAINSEEFACQYQNNPGTSEHAPLLEWQLRACFMDYDELRHNVPIENASVHFDTAFKDPKTISKGDDSAIVTWLHDMRPNGLVYLHTDLLKASNAWRAEDFARELIKILQTLKRNVYSVKCLTDEREGVGKEGIFRNFLMAALRGSGIRNIGQFHQLQRQGTNKKGRIRKAAALWADGYVRILLHKTEKCACPQPETCSHWIIPEVARKLFNQILRIDVVAHDDLADASADVFDPLVWRKPNFEMLAMEEGARPVSPGDSNLKSLSRPLSNDELKSLLDENEKYVFNNGLGPDDDWLPDRFG